jgi:hypothetical protein
VLKVRISQKVLRLGLPPALIGGREFFLGERVEDFRDKLHQFLLARLEV